MSAWAKTVSMSRGRVAIEHNLRTHTPENVDKEMTKNNETFINELQPFGNDIYKYTDNHYQQYIDTYNVGKKPCRQITETYTEHLAKENTKLLKTIEDHKAKGVKTYEKKPRQIAYEYVLQIGNHEDNPTTKLPGESDQEYESRIESNKEYCRDIVHEIREKYPHVHILLATFHADEPNGTPHVHITCQFEGEDYKKGLSHQVSVSRALELDGIARETSRTDGYSMSKWVNHVKDEIMEPALERHFGLEREILGEHRPHIETSIFREKAAAEARELDERREEVKQAEQSLTETHDRLDTEIDRKKEYAHALQEGGFYTNDQGEETHIAYHDSIEHMESTKERLKENVEAYENGGYYYDWDKQEVHNIPEGGIDQAVKTAQENVRTAQEALNEIRTENDTIKRENNLLGQNKTSLEGDLQALANQKLGAETDLASARWEYNAYVNGWTDQNGMNQPGINQLRAEYNNLTSGITKEKEQFNALWADYCKTADERDHIKAEIGQLATEKDSLTGDIDSMKAEYNELNGKIKSLQQIDKIQTQIKENKPQISTMEVSDGLLKGSHTVTVIEGYTPKELERVFAAAKLKHSAKETINDAKKEADSIIHGAHDTVEAAQQIQANADMIRQEADDYAKRKREEAAKEVQEAQEKVKTAEAEYRKYTNGWTDEHGKHLSLPQAKETYQQGMTKLQEQTAKITEYSDLIEGLEKDIANNKALSSWKPSEQDLKEAASSTITNNIVVQAISKTIEILQSRGFLAEHRIKCLEAVGKDDILKSIQAKPEKLLDNLSDELAHKAHREGRGHR